LALGGVLYLAYVVFIGGDFMRGRMFLPFFVTEVLVGAFALAQFLKPTPTACLGGLALVCLTAITFTLTYPPIEKDPNTGIVWEREYYREFHLRAVMRNKGELRGQWVDGNNTWTEPMAKQLRLYAAICGGVTIHAITTGYAGYSVGPGVKVIDLLGLTDITIAQLPTSLLAVKPPRAGHPVKYVPISYLAVQEDVSILQNWWEGIQDLDCGLKSRARTLANMAGYFNPTEPVLLKP
jgi:arabinofuranosyltransferase